MKKIGLIHFAYPPNTGGVEILLREHAVALTEIGYEVTVFTGSGEENNPKIKLVVIPELQSVLNINSQLQEKILEKGVIDEEFHALAVQIEKKLNQHVLGQDVIIVHNMLTIVRNLPFIVAFKNFVKNHPGKKYIAWVHDHSYITELKIKNLDAIVNSPTEKELLTTPINDIFYVAISNGFKKPLAEIMKLPPNKVQTIPNGINVRRFLEIDDTIWELIQKFKLLERFPIVLSPVNLLGRKNLEYSIDIIDALKKNFPDIRLIITGLPSRHRETQEYVTALKTRVQNLGLQENVIFLADLFDKALEESALRDLYSISDVVFYFSKSENFGLPLLEAGLVKTPIFVSNLEVFHEVGKDHVHYIDPHSVAAADAAEQIKTYITSSELIQGNFAVRSTYDLKTILKEKLLPLL